MKLSPAQLTAARAGLLVLRVEPPVEGTKHLLPDLWVIQGGHTVSRRCPHPPGSRIPLPDGGAFLVERVEAKQQREVGHMLDGCGPNAWLWLLHGRVE